ncbi:MAG: hypothetical protein E7Z87_06860 [Cyanobacteria bacterium SIG26]|nr:hypothetical protein [Cyanobacteria bacterium SIG26]
MSERVLNNQVVTNALCMAAVAGCLFAGSQVQAAAPNQILGDNSAYKYVDATDTAKTVTTYSKSEITKNYDSITGEEVTSGGVSVTMPSYTAEKYDVNIKSAEYGHLTGYDSVAEYSLPDNISAATNYKFYVDSSKNMNLSSNYFFDVTEQITKDVVGSNITAGGWSSSITGLYTFNSGGHGVNNESSINASFVNNTVSKTGGYGVNGAAITVTDGRVELQEINGVFINNKADATGASQWSSTAYGGAIYNSSPNTTYITGDNIKSITADFIGNRALANLTAHGGAIYNGGGKIGNINGDFVYNRAEAGTAYGGAIHNANPASKIGDITGDFLYNSVSGHNSADISGGAIYNSGGKIGNITGDFIGNHTSSDGTNEQRGGAIYSYDGEIGNISGNFINNYTEDIGAMTNYARGGAIHLTYGKVGDITGDFIGNKANCWQTTYGGAIYGYDADFGAINGNFIGNKAISGQGTAMGGAIFTSTTNTTPGFKIIDSIEGNFINNEASSYGANAAQGGAIWNKATIDKVHGDFIGNKAYSHEANATGGAIYNVNWSNEAKIGDLQGNFIENSVESYKASSSGGAIYNIGSFGEGSFKDSVFYKNSAIAKVDAKGGALYSSGGFTTGNLENVAFVENYAKSSDGYAMGGAIANDGLHTTGNISGLFIGNRVEGYDASGGAIYNNVNASIGNIDADFIGNISISDIHSEIKVRGGGAIANNGTVQDISGNFAGNTAVRNYGGGILNVGKINNITAEKFEQNDAAYGGAIANITDGQINDIVGSVFSKNTATYYGAAIFNHKRTTINNIDATFVENVAGKDGGAIWNDTSAVINRVTGDFVDNAAVSDFYDTKGGAIYNNASDITIENSAFTGNYAKSKGKAQGGAIYSNGNTTVVAKDGYQSVFEGNYVEDSLGKRDEAIYVEKDSTLTLKTQTGGQFHFEDSINGGSEYILNIEGDNSGRVFFNNHVNNGHLIHNGNETFIEGMQYFNNANGLGKNSLTMNGGTLNIGSLELQPLALNHFEINGGTININNSTVDLVNKTMGRIIADSYADGQVSGVATRATSDAKVYLENINLLNDAKENVTAVAFADKSFKNTVECPVTERITPIFRYRVSYDTSNKFGPDGYFVFTRGSGVNGSYGSSAYNPAILAGPVAAQVGGYAAQTAAFDYVFEHADAFSGLSSTDKYAIRNQNKYALSEGRLFTPGVSDLHRKAFWVRPYTSFESISLNNGPKVDTISYGTLIGGDGELKELRNGWATISTAYVGYNGSSQKYSGVSTYQNGGLLGLTQTFYKGNFYTALTATAGASVGESHTMYGQDNFTMLMAGVASRSGYNFEFKEGKYIIQPNWLMSYSYINTFDYTNAAGVKVDSDPMHAIQLKPSLKFIANAKNGWQPYASVGMVWSIMDQTDFTANGHRLPSMSMKPYVEYGVGVQKRWKDKFTGFLQAMIRNGGRNGIILTAGFRWSLGKEGKPIEKVENGSPIKYGKHSASAKLLKQL